MALAATVAPTAGLGQPAIERPIDLPALALDFLDVWELINSLSGERHRIEDSLRTASQTVREHPSVEIYRNTYDDLHRRYARVSSVESRIRRALFETKP